MEKLLENHFFIHFNTTFTFNVNKSMRFQNEEMKD